MDADSQQNAVVWTPLSQEGNTVFAAAIYQCLERWTGLQLAVQNEWGGRSSATKYQQFHTTIWEFFISSREQRYLDEVEDLLDLYVVDNFNTELEDNSITEVAVELLTIHEQCMLGNFEEVRRMMPPTPPGRPGGNGQSVRDSKQLASPEDQGDGDGNDQGELARQDIDKMDAEYSTRAPNMASLSTEPVPVASQPPILTEQEISEGWQTAPSRKTRRGRGQ